MEQSAGLIHSVETFGTVDGPGIRYIIFLQGCPLHCKYCHNRDTWQQQAGRRMTAREVVTDVKRYQNFYSSSGGGLTASGGEPLLQTRFVTEVFEGIRELRLNTALDTSGFVHPTGLEELLQLTDLVLLDIKAVDPQEHEQLTGSTNTSILNFARHLESLGKPMWIRHVLLPGVNDDHLHLQQLADLLKDFTNVSKVELLGYHKLGVSKWQACGQEDPLADVPAATSMEVFQAMAYLKNLGLKNLS